MQSLPVLDIQQLLRDPSGWQAAYLFNPRMRTTMPRISLPSDLQADAPGGQNARPDDPIFAIHGDNRLEFRVRSHPDVPEIHHPDLAGRLG